MPIEWMIILQDEKTDFVNTYKLLQNMKVSEVYDLLEAKEMRKMYSMETTRIQSLQK